MSVILDLLKKKGIEYKEKGADAMICCVNPEHEDSSPSMRIDKITGKFHCFSCGFGGQNIMDYFNEYYNPITRMALEIQDKISNILSDSIGITLPEGIEFYMGDHRGIHPQLYRKYNAFQHPDYEDRLCFPIVDSRGLITNIVGRNMFTEVPPKYKMYPAGKSVPIYPLHASHYVILVEGIFDMLNLENHGVENVSAIFGTQSLSDRNILEKMTPLMLSGVQEVVILLDNDIAGNKAARALKKTIELRTNMRVFIMNECLPEDKDPGSLSKEEAVWLDKEIKKLLY